MTLYTILDNIDSLCFFLLGTSVLYLFVFALLSHIKRKDIYPAAGKLHRFVILYPAYKEDRVIENAISNFLEQDYPKSCYDVVVISDQMQDDTINRLKSMPVTLMEVHFQQSSKAKAMQYAIENLDKNTYDMVVIMDADNTVEPNFLHELNKAYHSGCLVIQAHRMAKNLNTDTAILDAVSEEINNSIFRKGHVRLGLSAALIGSGMAIDFQWFKKNIFKLQTAGEDKELEALLLKENIFIEYLEHVNVYDEKTQKDSTFYNQRRRWLASQLFAIKNNIGKLPGALFDGKFDYANKICQWMMLPRVLLLGFIGIISIIVLLYQWTWAIKWFILELLLVITLSLAVPDYLVNEQFKKAVWKAPKLFLLMTLNLFRLRGVNKKFIHTEHGENNK
ncbi:MAG TPA: glycosyltransferase [Macellibacteroides fermentans]|uniref:glycosyltransferase n=1 Tax=Macellibacteroides fermentans TaxID=879969 RepID=UPI002CF85A45|nr:glycosyltransferase [Macellibacteroides fermentans]